MKLYIKLTILFYILINIDAQAQKDSLLISFDSEYLKKSKDFENYNAYYIISKKAKNGSFWLREDTIEVKLFSNQKHQTISNILKNKCFYTYRDDKNLLNNYKIFNFFDNCFLLKQNDTIKLKPYYAIE